MDSRWSQAASMIDCKDAFAMDAFWRGHTSPVKWNQPPANTLCISCRLLYAPPYMP
jgi:hypothetical protein